MTFPFLRKRTPAVQNIDVPGITRLPHIPVAVYGDTSAAETQVVGFYNFHQGDIFTGGAASWAMDPSHDTQLMSIWGRGVLRNQWPSVVPPVPATALLTTQFRAVPGIIINGIRIETLQQVMGQ